MYCELKTVCSYLNVRNCRPQGTAPVDVPPSAVHQPSLVQPYKGLHHGAGPHGVQREEFVVPIHTGAQALQLFDDATAVLVPPRPHLVEKVGATQLVPRGVGLSQETLFHHGLRGDARVIQSGNPQHAITAHATVARQSILHGDSESVADVQDSSDVGWW